MNATAQNLRLACRFALRELRGGLSGFVIFVSCIALGTAAIGGVNALSAAIQDALSSEGRTLLGGDLRFEIDQREAREEQRAFLAQQGELSETIVLRSMARLPDGSDQTLVEVKAVDDNWPLVGTVEVEAEETPLPALLAEDDGVHGALVPDLLLQRLDVAVGDTIALGNARFRIAGELLTEPDAASEGFAFAPRFLTSLDGLRSAGLLRPGALSEWQYRLKLPGDPSDRAVATVRESVETAFPEAGWSIRDRNRAAPGLARNIDRFSQFLTLVGLTALVVGGVGVANAVRSHVSGRREVIATLRSLGASGALVFQVYLIQILIIAALGIVIGCAIAAFVPPFAGFFLQGLLPVSVSGTVQWAPLLTAALCGLLVTLVFAIPALGLAARIRPAELFRDAASGALTGQAERRYLIAAAIAAGLLAGLALLIAGNRTVALTFMGGVLFAFLVLRIVGFGLQALARRAPAVRSTPLRLAIGNIHRPGALTPSVVLALGLGLTLLVAIGSIDTNLRKQISGSLPEIAPNFFFLDIQSDQIETFRAIAAQTAPNGELDAVPMLRGRIQAINGIDAQEWAETRANGGEWVLRGDRGLTYSPGLPDNSSLVDGEWWSEDYDGAPLVSFAEEEALELGLSIGDKVTVNVLGREITAAIANLRRVEWESLSINFVMVFSPNSFAGAPHSWLATLTDPSATGDDEATILRAVTNTLPTVTTIAVKDAISIVDRIVGQLAAAIRAAAAVALVASVLVLAGALAAGQAARRRDATVLKMLGATRNTLIAAFASEYALIGLATALFALAAGGAAAAYVISGLMDLPFTFDPVLALTIIGAALVLTVGFGLLGTWRILGEKAAPVLRNL
ncbi:glycosyl transferase family 1 [Notoacmeibacter marinus]|uniref:Glycosyl transferase family 1 n=1 Tax=Notoacmeibacter marinus TaxID=1876515 RepID=A0A231V270_9HYPH|nr:FtsX-like permease family protein [Notoacmeibacter marinus]OXT02295.1 glycosyl transferase family 1 [Notoacmeibacter marinus]